MAVYNDTSEGGNILKSLMNFLTPHRVERISDAYSIPPARVQAALTAVVPAVIGGIARFGSSGTGASKVMDFINRFDLGSVDPSRLFDQVLLSDAQQSDLQQASHSFLNVALGGSASEMHERAATYLSAGAPLLKKLEGLVVPLVMAFIGHRTKAEGGSVAWLSDFLNRQERIAAESMPAGLLGFAGTAKEREAATTAVATDSKRKIEDTDNRLGILWVPIAAVAALMIGGIWLYFQDVRQGDRRGVTDTTASDTISTDDAEVDGMASMLSSSNAKLRGVLATMDPGSEPQTVVFNDITFSTGTANLEPDAVQVVQNLAGVLREYPAARLRVEGHTDDTGTPEENQELSQQRAAAVSDLIVSYGIAEQRLEVVGKGAGEPVVTNETEEGRAQNSRIAVVVLGKTEEVAH